MEGGSHRERMGTRQGVSLRGGGKGREAFFFHLPRYDPENVIGSFFWIFTGITRSVSWNFRTKIIHRNNNTKRFLKFPDRVSDILCFIALRWQKKKSWPVFSWTFVTFLLGFWLVRGVTASRLIVVVGGEGYYCLPGTYDGRFKNWGT